MFNFRRKSELVVVANSIGKDKDGDHLVHFPSRWTASVGKSKCFTYYPYELAYLSTLLKRDTNSEIKMVDGNLLQLNAKGYIRLLKTLRPHILIMEPATMTYEEDLKVALAMKKLFGTKLIFVGQHVTAFPSQTKADGIDFICMGEYEYTVLDIVSGRDPKNILGLWPNERRELFDLDLLPFPEDEDISRFDYAVPGVLGCNYTEIEMFASRGCVMSCVFCVCRHLYYGKPSWRPRVTGSIIAEIKYLRDKYPGMEGIFFNEEDHNTSKDFIRRLTKAIKENGLETLKYSAMCGYWTLDREMLEAMKSAGYYKLRIGIETASESVAKAMGKKIDIPRLKSILEIAKEVGMEMYGTFTIGAPEATRKEDMKTVALINELVSKHLLHDLQISICTPQPGTPFYWWAKERNYLTSTDWRDYDGATRAVVSYPNYSGQEIEEVFDLAQGIYQYTLENRIKKKEAITNEPVRDPVFIQVETTNRCNMDCIMCDRESRNRHKKDMSADEFKHLIEKIPSLRVISLHGMGEPLLNKDIFEIIKIGKKTGAAIVFNTNGMLIDEKVHPLIESGLDELQISLDGATPEVCEKIRRGLNFERVIDNIRLLTKVKRDLGVQYPKLTIHFVAQKANIEELPKLVELCSDLGIEKISTEGMHNWAKLGNSMEQSVFSGIKSEIEAVCEKASLRAEQLDIKLSLFRTEGIGRTDRLLDYECHWLRRGCFITVGGYITPCCVCADPNIMNFGNIFQEGFQKIWHNEAYYSFRNNLLSDHRPAVCENCYYLLNYGIKMETRVDHTKQFVTA